MVMKLLWAGGMVGRAKHKNERDEKGIEGRTSVPIQSLKLESAGSVNGWIILLVQQEFLGAGSCINLGLQSRQIKKATN